MSNSETSIFSVVSSHNRQKSLSKTELVERYKHIILRSVEFIFALGMSNNVITLKKKQFYLNLFLNVRKIKGKELKKFI